MNPSTEAARWRQFRKTIARDDPALIEQMMLPTDWALGRKRGDGLVIAALEAQATRSALRLIELAPPEELALPDAQGQTPLFWALSWRNELGDEPFLALLARSPQAILERDGNGRGLLDRAARAQSWPQLATVCRLAASLPEADRLRALDPAPGEPPALALAIRHGAPNDVLSLLLDAHGELPASFLLTLLREAAWSGQAPAIDLIGERFSGSELLRQAREALLAKAEPAPPADKAAPQALPIAPVAAAAAQSAEDEKPEAAEAEGLVLLASAFDPEALKKRHPFLIACFRGHEAAARSLLALGFDGKGVDEMGRNALHAAIWARSVPLMRLAIEAGANCRKADSHGFSPLLLCATRFCEPAPLRVLRAQRVLLNGHTHRGQSALELACWSGSLAGVSWLLRRGAPSSRLAGSPLGPLEAALRSSEEPVAKAKLLMEARGLALSLADPALFVDFSKGVGRAGVAAGDAPVSWSAQQSAESVRASDSHSPKANSSQMPRMLSLCAAVMGDVRALEWLLDEHASAPVFSHFDFLAAWLRALETGQRRALALIEEAWRAHSASEPEFCGAQSAARCCEQACPALYRAAHDEPDLQWSVAQAPARARFDLGLGEAALPPGVARPPAPWLAWVGMAALAAKASAARARVAARADWSELALWEPPSSDTRSQLSFFCLDSGSDSLARERKSLLLRVGRLELRSHLEAAKRSTRPLAATWLFLRALALADGGEGKKSRLLAAQDALGFLRARFGGAPRWADALPQALLGEALGFERGLPASERRRWIAQRAEANRHSATLNEPRVFGESPWDMACRSLSEPWMRLLSEAGLPAAADAAALAALRLCAEAWSVARANALDAETRHEADRALTAAFALIAQNPVSEPGFRQADDHGRGPLFHCFVADAWAIALAHGAQTTRQAPGPRISGVSADKKDVPAQPNSALSALFCGASVDRLPALAFRCVSEARSGWGAPLIGLREADGLLPFAVALRGANLPQEAQRRLASLWPATLAEGRPDAAEQSLLLSRAAGCGLSSVADALMAAGVSLPSGGAPLVCSIARLKSAAERELLAEPYSANRSSLRQSSPQLWESSRLGGMVRWARAHGLDPFEPLPADGLFDVGSATPLPGFDPLLLAILNDHAELARALLLAGARADRKVRLGALPQEKLDQLDRHRSEAKIKALASVGRPDEIELDAAGILSLFPAVGIAGDAEWLRFAESLGQAGAHWGQTFNVGGSFGLADFLQHRPTLRAGVEGLALRGVVKTADSAPKEEISAPAPRARARRI